MSNSWTVINVLDEGINPNEFEKNEAIGMLALYIANAFDSFQIWRNYQLIALEQINKVISEHDGSLVNDNDREFVLYLSFLIHRSIHGHHSRSGSWPSNLPDSGKCSFVGCSRHADQRDHVWPNSLGGPYELWNFQWLCGFHNRMKSNSPMFAFKPSEEFRIEFTNWMRRTGQI